MNRRQFIAGLLASAAPLPVIEEAPVWATATLQSASIYINGRRLVAGDLVAGQAVRLVFNGKNRWDVI